jgi:hypothetical protein
VSGILASGQPRETFFLEDERDGDRAEWRGFPAERLADVVDRQALLAQGDDSMSQAVGLGGGFRAFGRGNEELPPGFLAELMGQNARVSPGATAAAGGAGGK